MNRSHDTTLRRELERIGRVTSIDSITLFGSLPIEVCFLVPFTSLSIRFGGSNLKMRRKQALMNPNDSECHLDLAALLLSQVPIKSEHAEEAMEEVLIAMKLLPSENNLGDSDGQMHATAHMFLGDALFELGQLDKAVTHWRRAVELDPVRPPLGISGISAERLAHHGFS